MSIQIYYLEKMNSKVCEKLIQIMEDVHKKLKKKSIWEKWIKIWIRRVTQNITLSNRILRWRKDLPIGENIKILTTIDLLKSKSLEFEELQKIEAGVIDAAA